MQAVSDQKFQLDCAETLTCTLVGGVANHLLRTTLTPLDWPRLKAKAKT